MFPESSIKVALDALSLKNEDTLIIDSSVIPLIPSIISHHNEMKFCVVTDYPGIRCSSNDVDRLLSEYLLPRQNYLGFFSDDEIREKLSGTPNLKLICGTTNDQSPFDPIGINIQDCSSAWNLVQSQSTESITAVICVENMQDGKELYRADMWPIFNFDDRGLSAVISFENFLDGWVFVWTGARSTNIEMVECFGTDTKKSVSVSPADIFVNGWNYTPTHYLNGYLGANPILLGKLASRITRGTSLSGKTLIKRGTVEERTKRQVERYAREPQETIISTAPLKIPVTLRNEGMHTIYENDLFYLDASSIRDDGDVMPEIIADIPEGQERYVVYPEDGMVLIVPRGGKGIALYNAQVPTLISNNLFVVFLNTEHTGTEYLRLALNCSYVRAQIRNLMTSSKLLGKKDIENIEIPFIPKEAQDAVLECKRAQNSRSAGLRDIADSLESVNAFQLWQELAEKDIADINEELDTRVETMVRDYVESGNWDSYRAWRNAW